MNAIQKLSRELLAAERRRAEIGHALFGPRPSRPGAPAGASTGASTGPERPAPRRPGRSR